MRDKILSVLAVLCIAALLASCGSPSEESSNEAEPVKTDKTITAIADACGLTDQEEVYFSMVGAADGAQFNGGDVELYIYDDLDNDSYKGFKANEGMYGTAYENDGVILVFVDCDPDQAIVDTFSALSF